MNQRYWARHYGLL